MHEQILLITVVAKCDNKSRLASKKFGLEGKGKQKGKSDLRMFSSTVKQIKNTKEVIINLKFIIF